MRLLIATDAWRPQINGVVRSLERMRRGGARFRRHHRHADAGGVPANRAAFLSRYPHRAGDAARDRPQDRRDQARPHPYRDRRADRLVDPRRLPGRAARLHHQLSHPFSAICRGALADPRELELQLPAPLPWPGRCGDGLDRDGRVRARGPWFRADRALGARCRPFAVPSAPGERAGFAAADLPQRRPCRGREESRCLFVAAAAGQQGRGRRWPGAGGIAAGLSGGAVPRGLRGRASWLRSTRPRMSSCFPA